MTPQIRPSRTCVELVKRFEGLRRRAARLEAGGWTVGYGHTASAREGAEVSQVEAEILLIYDLSRTAEAVDPLVSAPLNQNQFDALVAFAFNVGLERFRDSAVLKRINEGDLLQAAEAFELWRRADIAGETLVIDELVRRRAAEKALFLTPAEGFRPVPTPVVRPELDHAMLDLSIDGFGLGRAVQLTAPLDGEVATALVDPPPFPRRAGSHAPSATAAAHSITARLQRLFPDEPAAPETGPLEPPIPPDEPANDVSPEPETSEPELRVIDGAPPLAPEPFADPPAEPPVEPPAVQPSPGRTARFQPAEGAPAPPFAAPPPPPPLPRAPLRRFPSPPEPPGVGRARAAPAPPGPPEESSFDASEDRRPWVLWLLGVLGFVLFAGALAMMIYGPATLLTLALGLLGVMLLAPGAMRLLLQLLGDRSDWD